MRKVHKSYFCSIQVNILVILFLNKLFLYMILIVYYYILLILGTLKARKLKHFEIISLINTEKQTNNRSKTNVKINIINSKIP
jgi:hypothetical protein